MPLAIFYGCTARFVSDLVGTPEDKFSSDAAQMFFWIVQLNSLHTSPCLVFMRALIIFYCSYPFINKLAHNKTNITCMPSKTPLSSALTCSRKTDRCIFDDEWEVICQFPSKSILWVIMHNQQHVLRKIRKMSFYYHQMCPLTTPLTPPD